MKENPLNKFFQHGLKFDRIPFLSLLYTPVVNTEQISSYKILCNQKKIAHNLMFFKYVKSQFL